MTSSDTDVCHESYGYRESPHWLGQTLHRQHTIARTEMYWYGVDIIVELLSPSHYVVT